MKYNKLVLNARKCLLLSYSLVNITVISVELMKPTCNDKNTTNITVQVEHRFTQTMTGTKVWFLHLINLNINNSWIQEEQLGLSLCKGNTGVLSPKGNWEVLQDGELRSISASQETRKHKLKKWARITNLSEICLVRIRGKYHSKKWVHLSAIYKTCLYTASTFYSSFLSDSRQEVACLIVVEELVSDYWLSCFGLRTTLV